MKEVLKCPTCGAPLEYNQETSIATCPSCGSKSMIKEDKIAYEFNTTQNITKNIYSKDIDDIEDFLSKGDIYLNLKEYQSADTEYNKAISDKPSDYRGWLGLARLAVVEYQAGYILSINESLFENAIKLAPSELKEGIQTEYDSIKKTMRDDFENMNKIIELEKHRRAENITDELLNIPLYDGEIKNYKRMFKISLAYIIISLVILIWVIIGALFTGIHKIYFLIIGAVVVVFLYAGVIDYRYYRKNKILMPLLANNIDDLAVLKGELGLAKEGEVLALIQYDIKNGYLKDVMIKNGKIIRVDE